jgi:hypothetical protein
MKQMRGLLIAAIALAVLSGLVYWSKKHKADAAKNPSPDDAPKILTLDDKQVDEVHITKSGQEPLLLLKLGSRWDIAKPTPMPADQDAVNSLVTAASSLTSERLIDENPASLAAFGLAAPVTRVTLHLKNGKNYTILFGSDTPAGGATYAKLSGGPKVYSVPTYTKTSIDKSLNDLRDKRLLVFDQDKIARVDLTPAKGPEIEFGKNGQGDWQILKPEPVRADGLAVDDLVRKLKEARINLDSGKIAESTFNSTPKVATVSVTDNGGTQTAELRRDKDKNTYAKSSLTDAIYKVGADLADALSKPLTDFRNKKLFDFGFSEISTVTAQGSTYSKTGEKWFSNGKEMDSASVSNLIDKLRDLAGTGFVPKISGNAIFEAAVTTQDKKRTEKITVNRSGSETYAQRDGEPAIYILDNAVADDLIKAAADVKAATPAAKAPAKK